MTLIDRTVPLPLAWPPPRSDAEFESLKRYLRFRDPVGFVVHLTLACLALFLAPLWQAPSAIAFGALVGYSLIRIPNTWRSYSALLAEPAIVAWAGFGCLLAVSLAWNPFGPSNGLDHLGAWRVMAYPLLLLPVLPARRILLATLLLGCLAQFGFMSMGSHGISGNRLVGPLHNINLTGMWGAALAVIGSAALFVGCWWGLIITGAGVFTSAFTGSRGSLFALAVGIAIVITFGTMAARGRERWLRPCRVLLPLTAVIILAMVLFPTSLRRIERNAEAVATNVKDSSSQIMAGIVVDPTRYHLWRLAGLKARERPVLGWGFGAYPSICQGTIDAFDRTWWTDPGHMTTTITNFRGSHSMYLRVACEQGLVGMVVLFTAVAVTIDSLSRLLKGSALALGGLGVMIVWLIYAGSEDAHTMTRALLPVPLILSLVLLGQHFDLRQPS